MVRDATTFQEITVTLVTFTMTFDPISLPFSVLNVLGHNYLNYCIQTRRHADLRNDCYDLDRDI